MNEKVEILIPAEAIENRLREMADEIMRDYADKTITFVCVLKGGAVFAMDLARKISLPVEFEFLDVASYGNDTTGGTIKFNKDVGSPVTGKNVVIIEDIIDSGKTLSFLYKYLSAQDPAMLRICALLDKPDRRVASDFKADYTGFVIPDKFVVGFGLDYAQRYRNLPYVGVLEFVEA